ncbi:cysteine hydrolase family protein [Paenibacillus woosongensis]|uniref:Cysteine hydrolase family protein n=1 Tax=Paenibacillus woosongensis TaxID=307580 RepID=A0AA95I828_9BACL|nr:cysteine hydrolase family protein [Paenibacillus woosongensis]WHX50971.1 cysteine hydrolase family protein [Paenibacillus woosongensis]
MKNAALLVVDVQNALVEAKPFDIEVVISNIERLISTCRENSIEVIYVQHDDPVGEALEPNTEGWQIYSGISPLANEKVINKKFNSAFKGTNLKEYLERKGIEQLIITGMQTEYCIDTTLKAAFEYGFQVMIPERTNTTFDNGDLLASDLYHFYNFNIFQGRFGIVEPIEDTVGRIKNQGC